MFQPLVHSVCILTFSLQVLFSGGPLFIPARTPETAVYAYPGYTLEYAEEFEQARWVGYELTREEVTSTAAERTDNFKPDPAITTGSATDEDYRKSGYDRGHLAPAADMKFSVEAMNTCFYYSNMSPQNASFNRGVWAALEAMVRTWAVENGAVYVITGPVLTSPPYKTIGPDKVAVPAYFYKVILDYRDPERKAIAFLLPNQKLPRSPMQWACSVDQAEAVTGLDFFPQLPDAEESRLESSFNISKWPQIEYKGKK